MVTKNSKKEKVEDELFKALKAGQAGAWYWVAIHVYIWTGLVLIFRFNTSMGIVYWMLTAVLCVGAFTCFGLYDFAESFIKKKTHV